MELRTLRYFLAVAQEENISRAAETLHLTQPTLSRQMMDLEAEFGKKLFIRGQRRITLTEDGMLLRKRAREIVDLAEKTDLEMRSDREAVAGPIRIGSGETAAVRYLADIAGQLRREHPGVRYSISSGDSQDIREELDKGLIDFAVFVGDVDMGRYESLRLPHEDVWGVLMPKDHPLAEKAAVGPEDLRGQPILFSRQACFAGTPFEWLGQRFDQTDMAGSYSLIYNGSLLVEAGVGLLVGLDGIINTSGDSKLAFRPLEPRVTARVSIAWKKYQVFSTPAKKYLELLRQRLEAAE